MGASLILLVRQYARPILIGLAIAGVLLVFRFVYNAGYNAAKQSQLEAQIQITKEVTNAYELIDRDGVASNASLDAKREWLLQHGVR